MNLRATHLTSVLALAAFASLATACAGKNTTDESAQLSSDESALLADGSDSAQAGDTAAAIISVPLLPMSKAEAIASVDTAATAAVTSGSYFQPVGCVTATRAANVVTYTFVECTGPFGLVHVNGKIIATLTKGATAGTMDVAVKSDGLMLNKTPIDQSATAHVTFSGTTRTVKWDGHYSGTTPGGRKIDHTADYTSSFDSESGCVQLAGTGQTTIDGRGLKNQVTDYKRCGGRSICPSSGEIVSTGVVSGLSIKVDFVGGNHVDVTGVKGHVFHVTLPATICTAS